jgi:hypothetical protein
MTPHHSLQLGLPRYGVKQRRILHPGVAPPESHHLPALSGSGDVRVCGEGQEEGMQAGGLAGQRAGGQASREACPCIPAQLASPFPGQQPLSCLLQKRPLQPINRSKICWQGARAHTPALHEQQPPRRGHARPGDTS